MACGCKSRGGIVRAALPSVAGATSMASAYTGTPHEVLPGESCIFCAEKHLSSAYVEVMRKGHLTGTLIGDLELARRHTVYEYPRVADKIAELLVLASSRMLDGWTGRLQAVLDLATLTASGENPDISGEGEQYMLPKVTLQVANPLIGELHLCAAYRLAFEVGYMMHNRHMIVGDLALAAEHFVKISAGVTSGIRELRHRVQTTRATDINKSWPLLVNTAGDIVEARLEDYRRSHLPGLRLYVGLPDALPDPAEAQASPSA